MVTDISPSFLNLTEEGEGTETNRVLITEAAYTGLRSQCQSLVLMPIPEEQVLWAMLITWGVFIPKRERERKDVSITWLSGSSSHQTQKVMSAAPGGQRILLLPSSHSGPTAIKRVLFFVPIHDSMLKLVQLFPSLSHEEELSPCQTLGVFFQEILQYHSCDVAREMSDFVLVKWDRKK